MNNIVVDENSKNIIIGILSDNLSSGTEIYVFGSRTKGTIKKYADLDLAIKSFLKIEQSVLDNLNIAFENSILPFKIDIIDLNNIDSDFLNAISSDLTLFLKID